MVRRLFVVLAFVLVFSPALSQEVQVFLTSTTHPAGMLPTGGLAGGDQRCTDVAQAEGLSGAWTAWLSTSTVDARDRIIDARYVLLNGTVIADNLADLTDGTLAAPLNVLEDGQVDSGSGTVWTSTSMDGTFDSATTACQDWTVDAADSGSYGTIGATNEDWTRANSSGCGIVRHLYCFSAFQVPVELEEASVK